MRTISVRYLRLDIPKGQETEKNMRQNDTEENNTIKERSRK